MTKKNRMKVAQNPNNKKWYVVGSTGSFWMPTSSGFKTRAQAVQKMAHQKRADAAARRELSF